MSDITSVTLEQLEAYAKRWFPQEFAMLPPVTTLKFDGPCSIEPRGSHSKQTGNSRYASPRLSVGNAHPSPAGVWASLYGDEPYRVKIIQIPLLEAPHEVRGRINYKQPFVHCTIFRAASSSLPADHQQFADHYVANRRGLDELIRYYFLAKGIIPQLSLPKNALPIFEWAVRSVAAKKLQPEGADIEDLRAYNKLCLERFQAIKDLGAFKIPTSLSSSDSSKEGSQMSKLTQRDEKHMVLMMEVIQEQDADRHKPKETVEKLTIENMELNNIVQELKEQNEQLRQQSAGRESTITSLKVKLEAESHRRGVTEIRLRMASHLYECHKQLLSVQSRHSTPNKREEIMTAFEQEFGGLYIKE